jgi:hypothetical protein
MICLLDYQTIDLTLFEIYSINISFPLVNAFQQLCGRTQFEQGPVTDKTFLSLLSHF